MTLKEIFDALYKKVDELNNGEAESELVELKSHPGFQELIDLIIEQNQKRLSTDSGNGLNGLAGDSARHNPLNPLQKSVDSAPIKNLAIIYSAKHQAHFSPVFKEESPARIEAILTTLRASGISTTEKTIRHISQTPRKSRH